MTHPTLNDRSPAGLLAYLAEVFPDDPDSEHLEIEALEERFLRLRLRAGARHLRPGGTISGPALMKLADTAMYFAVMGGPKLSPRSVTSQLSIHFLKRPAPGDLIAEATIIHIGGRTVTLRVELFSEGDPDPVAFVTGTYHAPRDRSAGASTSPTEAREP